MPTQKQFDPKKYRDNPAAIAEYLNSALATADLAQFVTAIGSMMRAQNVLALSEETGLNRENMYKMFAGHRDPKLGNTMKVLASLGVQFYDPACVLGAAPTPSSKIGQAAQSRASHLTATFFEWIQCGRTLRLTPTQDGRADSGQGSYNQWGYEMIQLSNTGQLLRPLVPKMHKKFLASGYHPNRL